MIVFRGPAEVPKVIRTFRRLTPQVIIIPNVWVFSRRKTRKNKRTFSCVNCLWSTRLSNKVFKIVRTFRRRYREQV